MLAAVPFAFAGIRFHETGNDTRYLWMAAISTLCVAAVLVRPGSAISGRTRIGVATIAAAAGAAVTALLFGASAGSGIAIVAVAFGLCSALGAGLVVGSRASTDTPRSTTHSR